MNQKLRADADAVIHEAIRAVLPDAAVRRALAGFAPGGGRVLLVAAGKAAWQMAHAAGGRRRGGDQVRPCQGGDPRRHLL